MAGRVIARQYTLIDVSITLSVCVVCALAQRLRRRRFAFVARRLSLCVRWPFGRAALRSEPWQCANSRWSEADYDFLRAAKRGSGYRRAARLYRIEEHL